jgi:predicted membrane protein
MMNLGQTDDAISSTTPSIHWPCLGVALLIMLAGVLYPPLMADATGKADHTLAMALFWAMSAGFVRGVGFIPRLIIWRCFFSAPACFLALALAATWGLVR